MTTERQKKGMDGEAISARELKKAGESADVELDERLQDKVDPAGHVSSGLQPKPMRPDPDETIE